MHTKFSGSTVLLCLVAACAVEGSDLEERGFSLPTYSSGLVTSPGLALGNGESLADGLGAAHGINVASPLITGGLFSTGTAAGVLDSPEGRELVKTLVGCALPPGQSITKTVAGTPYTFQGKVGVAAAWKSSSCSMLCRHWVSACILAHSNATDTTRAVEMRATNPAIGTTMKNVANTEQERAWFGNLFANPPTAYQASGVDIADPDLLDRDCGGNTPCAIVNLGTMADRCIASGAESASFCSLPYECTTTECNTTGGAAYLPVTTHYAPCTTVSCP